MFVTHVITELDVGGAESFLARLVGPLNSRHQCEVISLTTRGALSEAIESQGVRVRALGMTATGAPAGLLRLAAWLRSTKPDVVQTWLYHSDIIGGVAARLAGVRSVVWNLRQTELSPLYTSRRTMLTARLGAALSGMIPDQIVCCAEAARASHTSLGYAHQKMVVISNGVDTERFRPNQAKRLEFRQQIGAAPDAPVIGMVGRFDPQKNHRGFFEMAAAVRRRWPATTFVAAGRDVEITNTTARAWVAEFALSERLHLLGLQRNLERILPGLDLLVSPSHDEGFPNAVAEAMGCGVPAVVTDAGDSFALVGNTGICVPKNSVNDLVEGVMILLSDRSDLADRGLRARARVVDMFSLDTAVRRYAELYDSLA